MKNVYGGELVPAVLFVSLEEKKRLEIRGLYLSSRNGHQCLPIDRGVLRLGVNM